MSDVVSIFRPGPRKGLRRAVGGRTWYERGIAAEAGADLDGARCAYERALIANPDLGDAACNLGRLHHERGELATAESWYRLALCTVRRTAHEGADRAVAVYWFNLGVAVEDQGRRAEAIACYRAALAIDARLAEAHFNLARLYERAADVDSAHAAIRHFRSYRTIAG
jgi:tetratricopeptide (TPR) repeat protein